MKRQNYSTKNSAALIHPCPKQYADEISNEKGQSHAASIRKPLFK